MSRRSLCLLGLILLVSLAVLQRKLLARVTHPPKSPNACELRDSLLAANPAPRAAANHTDTSVVRLFWWFRFQGARRAARPHAPQGIISCAEHSLQCILDSRDAAFASAHAVIVWVGARPESTCLPPKLPDHIWVVEYSESPAYYPELWDAAFMSQFHVKVSYEYDSDVVLATGIHPLVEGGVVPPDRWLRGALSTPPMATSCTD